MSELPERINYLRVPVGAPHAPGIYIRASDLVDALGDVSPAAASYVLEAVARCYEATDTVAVNVKGDGIT